MRQAKGFSLLEILIAFAIMAVALTVVVRIFGSGVNNAVLAEEYSLAVQIAESLLARTGVETPLLAGETAGSQGDRYDWRVNIVPLDLNEAPAEAPKMQLFTVDVHVSWGDGHGTPRTLTLHSVRSAALEK